MAKKTLVVLLLDETGSMEMSKESTIRGFNEYLNSLREEENFDFILTRFNSEKIDTSDRAPIAEAEELTDESYQPNHLTPLYDAMGKTISSIKKKKRVLFVVITDGKENYSKAFNRSEIFDLVKKKEKSGWTFVFLGANQDSYLEGGKMGFADGNIRNYSQGDEVQVFHAVTKGTLSYAENRAVQTDSFWEDSETEEVSA
jgi:uncharacterized protein with von Willebrand factor type A (vWA) domain